MADYKITRMELATVRAKARLAKKGHNLLKRKRDALVAEFMKILRETSDLREKLEKIAPRAVERISLAEAIDGREAVESASLAVKSELDVSVRSRNVMGVLIPDVSCSGEIHQGYGMLGTSVRLDEAADEYSKLVRLAVELAKYEVAIKKLLDETEKTKRRVNALEYVILPRLEKGSAYIRMRLDELEREDFFRLKMVKRKMERKAGNGGA